jgi:prepilin-type processing-associated H-X9-DG protein
MVNDPGGISRVGYAGDDWGRDGLTRAWGVVGYSLLIHTTGCSYYPPNRVHWAPWLGPDCDGGWGWEMPGRPRTKHRDVDSASHPAVWVATCIPVAPKISGCNYVSHFGLKRNTVGRFRFNILHLDGHVDESVWQETRDTTPSWGVPYGWKYANAPAGNPLGGNNQAGVDEPLWDGAVDTNP